LIDRKEIDEEGNAGLSARTPFDTGPISVSIVLCPGKDYALTRNGRKSEVQADVNGFIGLIFHSDAGQTTEIELKGISR
jgi:hypothetical protein